MARIPTVDASSPGARGLIALAALALSGCMANVASKEADRSVPNHWRHDSISGERAAAPGPPATPPVDLQQWWLPFHEPALDRLVAQALAANLGIREAMARLTAARASERAAKREFWPTLQATGSPATTPDASKAYYQAALDIGWETGLFGRASAAALAANADRGIAAADVMAARTMVVAETVRTYLQLRAARAEQANLAARIAAQSERVRLTRVRQDLRLGSRGDLDQEEFRLQELESQRLANERVTAENAERLGLLLAQADAESCAACGGDEPTVPLLASFRVAEVPADLLRTRPDVRRAEMAVLEATAELNLARAELYPRLVLVGSLTVSAPVSGSSLGAAGTIASMGPTLDIPLFDWGRRRARVDARDATLEAALLGYRQTILQSVHEVETALAALETMRWDVSSSRLRDKSAERAERVAEDGARLHRVSQLDVLAARLERLEAERATLQAERAHGLAFVALFEALGGAALSPVAHSPCELSERSANPCGPS